MAKWMEIEVPFWLIVVIGLGLVLLVSLQSPSYSSSPSRRDGNRSSKSKEAGEKEAPASDAAKEVAKRLGVSVGGAVATGRARRRVPVTVCVNDVVLRRSSTSSQDGEWVAIDSAVKTLALLNEVAAVFLVAWVESDLEESLVKDVAISSGLITPSASPLHHARPDNSAKPSAAPPAAGLGLAGTAAGIAEHRLLFCSSHIGQVAVVRQLAPSLHIGGPIALLEGICRFVPSLVRIDPSAVTLFSDDPDADATMSPAPQTSEEEQASNGSATRNNSRDGGYELEWREFPSLAAAAGLASATTADDKSNGNADGDGDCGDDAEDNSTVEASTSTSTLTSKPDAEGAETGPLYEDAVSGSSNVIDGQRDGSAGVFGA
eukprot:g13762.t1